MPQTDCGVVYSARGLPSSSRKLPSGKAFSRLERACIPGLVDHHLCKNALPQVCVEIGALQVDLAEPNRLAQIFALRLQVAPLPHKTAQRLCLEHNEELNH